MPTSGEIYLDLMRAYRENYKAEQARIEQETKPDIVNVTNYAELLELMMLISARWNDINTECILRSAATVLEKHINSAK